MAGPGDQNDVHSQIQDALFHLLLDKIRQDQYPSTTMMNLVEETLTEDQLREYAEILLDKIESDQFPSIPMLRRIAALAS
jgi:hypothetical protein